MPDHKPIPLEDTGVHKLFAKIVGPLVKPLERKNVDPNWVTGASVVFAFLAAYCLSRGMWWQAIVLIACNGLCDVSDGELARKLGDRRKFYLKKMGDILDGFTDRIADVLLFTGLIDYVLREVLHADPKTEILILTLVIALGAHIVSSYLRTSLEKHGHPLGEKRPLTRAGFHVCVILVCFGVWLLPIETDLVFYWGTISTVCLLTIGNLIKRMIAAYRIFRSLEST